MTARRHLLISLAVMLGMLVVAGLIVIANVALTPLRPEQDRVAALERRVEALERLVSRPREIPEVPMAEPIEGTR